MANVRTLLNAKITVIEKMVHHSSMSFILKLQLVFEGGHNHFDILIHSNKKHRNTSVIFIL